MKKFLLVILILFIGFSGYIAYDNYFKDKIKKLTIEEEVIDIQELYIYGTHLNMKGSIVNDSNLDFVLYNGEFTKININIKDNYFNLSDYVNEGLYLEDIKLGNYYMFLRSSNKDSDGNDIYKYYSLKNNTKYSDTTYYTFTNKNYKITISNDNEYPTMKMNVEEVKTDEVYDIVLDPGHGGRDGGANRYGYDEDDFTMDLALKIKEKLESSGIKVKLTREKGQLKDTEKLNEYGVHGRAVIAHEVNAKYVFSLHLNSNVDSSVNGLEVYTADNINYNFAKNITKNITTNTGLNYSNNKINKVFDGIYTRTFTNEDVEESIKEYEDDKLIPYDVTTKSNYYYIIRENGGIVTGAYVDDRNAKIEGNPYCNSNVGIETYLLELGYISNRNNLDNMINNMDKYVDAISNSIIALYNNN